MSWNPFKMPRTGPPVRWIDRDPTVIEAERRELSDAVERRRAEFLGFGDHDEAREIDRRIQHTQRFGLDEGMHGDLRSLQQMLDQPGERDPYQDARAHYLLAAEQEMIGVATRELEMIDPTEQGLELDKAQLQARAQAGELQLGEEEIARRHRARGKEQFKRPLGAQL